MVTTLSHYNLNEALNNSNFGDLSNDLSFYDDPPTPLHLNASPLQVSEADRRASLLPLTQRLTQREGTILQPITHPPSPRRLAGEVWSPFSRPTSPRQLASALRDVTNLSPRADPPEAPGNNADNPPAPMRLLMTDADWVGLSGLS